MVVITAMVVMLIIVITVVMVMVMVIAMIFIEVMAVMIRCVSRAELIAVTNRALKCKYPCPF